MVCQCVLDQRLCFCIVKQRQQRLFLDLEMRLQFICECPDCALADCTHLFCNARLGGTFACLRQRQGGVMLTR